jgi:hypothetical protein
MLHYAYREVQTNMHDRVCDRVSPQSSQSDLIQQVDIFVNVNACVRGVCVCVRACVCVCVSVGVVCVRSFAHGLNSVTTNATQS